MAEIWRVWRARNRLADRGRPCYDDLAMGCTYHLDEDEFGIYDVLEDREAGVRVRIRRVGAEMVSLCRLDAGGEWRGFLYRDNETGPPGSGWGNHATVMGYFIHRLVDQKSDYDGFEIRGGNHGFLRSFKFEAPTFNPGNGSITYRVPSGRIPEQAYPLRVSMDLVYRLDGERVRIEFRFHNEETEFPAFLSFGIHPGFAVSSLEDAEVLLPAGTYIRHWAPGNFLDGRVERVTTAGGPMPFDKGALPDSYLVGLGEVPERTMVLRDPVAGREVELDFSEVPYMTLWSDAGPFICIEPCWGLPDSLPQKPFPRKDGIQRVEAASTLSAGFSIRASLLS